MSLPESKCGAELIGRSAALSEWQGKAVDLQITRHAGCTATPGCVIDRTITVVHLKQHRQECLCRALPALGGLLGAVEGVEETREGLCAGREIVYPAKVPDHFAHHVGLAGVIPFVEKVIVDADGEQHIPMLAVFLLQGALDFANHGRAFERMLGADHHQLVIMPDTRLLRLSMMSWAGRDYWPPVPASKNRSRSPSTNWSVSSHSSTRDFILSQRKWNT